MTPLLIISIIISLAVAIALSLLVPKFVKTEKQKRICLLIGALGTIIIHYSGLLYHYLYEIIEPGKISSFSSYLGSNPNLLFPIYPCNFVMWGLLILALIKNTESKFFKVSSDFLFLFGIVSGLGGLIANGDYFSSSVPKDWDIYKSVVAHSFMIFNLLCIKTLGYFKLEPIKNIIRVTVGIIAMGLTGFYCSAVAYYIGGKAKIIEWNSMFLFRTPIDGLNIVRFHIVMPLFIVLLFVILYVIDLIIKKKKAN